MVRVQTTTAMATSARKTRPRVSPKTAVITYGRPWPASFLRLLRDRRGGVEAVEDVRRHERRSEHAADPRARAGCVVQDDLRAADREQGQAGDEDDDAEQLGRDA